MHGDPPLDLGAAALPFTVLAVLGFINAVNFLEGLDGLAAGVGLVVWLGLLVLTLAGGLWPFAALALVVTLRRRLRGGPLRADRTHLHHLLLDRGLRPRLVVLLLVALTGVYATLGVAGWYVLGLNDEALFLLFVCAGGAQAWATFWLVRSAPGPGARRGRSGG